jgi:cytochrome c oxidase subunit 2
MVVLMRVFLLLVIIVFSAGVDRSELSADTADQATGGPGTGPQQLERIQAERFSFAPSEVRVTLGTTLIVELKSDDTDHGFHILGTDINVSIPKRGRGTATVTFTPDKVGRYTFECSHVCGAGHSFMRGEIVVSAPSAGTR